jgi:hypothetical protein
VLERTVPIMNDADASGLIHANIDAEPSIGPSPTTSGGRDRGSAH